MIVEQSTCFAPQTSVEAYVERRRSTAGQASPQFAGAFTPQPTACGIPLSPSGQQPQVASCAIPHRYQRGFQNPSASAVAPYMPTTRPFPDPTFQVGGMWYDNTFSSAARQQQPYNGFTSAHTRYISTSAHNAAIHRKNATRESTSTLKTWLHEHSKNPYPTKGEKVMLAVVSKMTLTQFIYGQVSTWFANARRRLKKENKMTWVPKHKPSDSSSQQTQPIDDCSITDDANESTLDADADLSSSLSENPVTNITNIVDIGRPMEYQGDSQRTITYFKPGSTDFCFPASSNQQITSATCLSATGRSAFNASTLCQQGQTEFPSTLPANPEEFAPSLPFASSCSSYQANPSRLAPIKPQDINFHFQSQQTQSRNYYDIIKHQEPYFQSAPTQQTTANHTDWPNNQSQFGPVYSTPPISYADVGSRGNDRATSTGNCSETASEPAEFYFPKYEDSSPEPPPETTFAPTKSMWSESPGFPNNNLTTQLPVW